jgi:hypothetical protein
VDDDVDGPASAPPPLSLLADLQAGLLDDSAAARLRHRARTDPVVAGQLAALDRVRREMADLGTDSASAPDIPAEVTARIGAALRAEPPPGNRVVGLTGQRTSHSVHGPTFRWRTAAAVAGIVAAVAAIGVGTMVLLRDDPAGMPTAGPTASFITMSPPPGSGPVTNEEILALLTRPPDLGPLADPQRRASCLAALGYSTRSSVLGARPLDVNGRPGVLLLLPGDMPRRINAVVVAPNCSAADTGLLASTVINRR